MSSSELKSNLGYHSPGRPQGSVSATAMRARIPTVDLPVDMDARLRELVKRENLSMAGIIRRAISRELDFCDQL